MSQQNFDKFMKDLQEQIKQKELEDYNEYIVELFHNPRNYGKPLEKDITVSQAFTGPCGDTMEMFLKINKDIIENAHFTTDGCGASFATASQATLLIEGKPIEYAEKLNAQEIDKALHGLPEDHKHCAELAARTLHRAIKKYKESLKL